MTDRQLHELAQQLRVDAVRSSAAAGSGHPTSSMSAADLMAVLLARHLRYDFDRPDDPANDHLVFSKGHASPLLYAMYKAAGAISDKELLTFRQFGSRLQGHPTPELPWVDVATGSLGLGLPAAVGIALSAKRLEHRDYRVWVLCGDSEMSEGSIWEALEHAAYESLDNLTAIVDVNRLGQRGETMHGWDLDSYTARAEAAGWNAIQVDGHDLDAVDRAYTAAAETKGRPTLIAAKTRKGRGVKAVEDQEGAHGQPVPDADEAVAELGGERDLVIQVAHPPATDGSDGSDRQARAAEVPPAEPGGWDVGEEVPTRKAYGEALNALGSRRADIVALDGEVGNSTYAGLFAAAHPERYFEMFIAEQQLVGSAVGLATRGWVPYASSFAAFLTRAYDFVRMAALSRVHICLAGSHAGISIGTDGPSQMGLEDLAAFRAVQGSTVLYPCDANQTARLVEAMADLDGVAYIRTTRGGTPVRYPSGEEFPVGGSKVLRSSPDDAVTVVAAGITVLAALEAADRLAGDGLPVRVIDAYSVKPIDAAGLVEAATATGGRVVTVEDHWPEGGLGDAVLDALATSGEGLPVRVTKLAVRDLPHSGKPDELLHAYGIDADAVVAACHALVERESAAGK